MLAGTGHDLRQHLWQHDRTLHLDRPLDPNTHPTHHWPRSLRNPFTASRRPACNLHPLQRRLLRLLPGPHVPDVARPQFSCRPANHLPRRHHRLANHWKVYQPARAGRLRPHRCRLPHAHLCHLP